MSARLFLIYIFLRTWKVCILNLYNVMVTFKIMFRSTTLSFKPKSNFRGILPLASHSSNSLLAATYGLAIIHFHLRVSIEMSWNERTDRCMDGPHTRGKCNSIRGCSVLFFQCRHLPGGGETARCTSPLINS